MPQVIHQFVVVEVQHILLRGGVNRLRRVCRRRLLLVHGRSPGAAVGLVIHSFANKTSKPTGARRRPGRCHKRYVRTGRHQGDQSRREAVVSCYGLDAIQPRVCESRRRGTHLDGITLAVWGKEVAWRAEPSASSTPAAYSANKEVAYNHFGSCCACFCGRRSEESQRRHGMGTVIGDRSHGGVLHGPGAVPRIVGRRGRTRPALPLR